MIKKKSILKNLIVVLLLLVKITLFLNVQNIYAFDFKDALDKYKVGVDTGGSAEETLIDKLVIGNLNWFVGLVGILALGFLIYGAVLFIIAGGDEQRLQKAVTTIRNALIGLALALLSGLIINFVINRITSSLGGGGGGSTGGGGGPAP